MIKVIKLVTGEDIVADIEIQDTSSGKVLILKNPQRFMITSEGIGSIPLMPVSDDDKYTISMNHIVLICEPDVTVKNAYNSQFGSGIVVASGKDIQI